MAEEHESNSFELGALAEAIQSGDPRRELEGIRDFLVQELEGHRCKACMMSKLRTGDTAALVLRLQQILAELKQVPTGEGKVSELDRIRQRREAQRATAPKAESPADPAVQRRSGSRRPSGGGGPVA
jgi:hypothetical protein